MVTPAAHAGRVYLDHAATAPLRPAARDAFVEAAGVLGNPSALGAAGRAKRAVLETAREDIAAALRVDPAEVVLTAGGTEADNLALRGISAARRAADPARDTVIVSAIEHPAVLETAADLDARVLTLPVTADGVVDLDALAGVLETEHRRIALLSVMTVNNEIGTIQPVAEVARLAAAHGIPVHTDAVQAAGHLDLDPHRDGIAALTISGHKLGGTVGTGALVIGRATPIRPVTTGGLQERGLRSGTLDAAGAAALAAALSEASAERDRETARLTALRERLEHGMRAIDPSARLSGEAAARAPHIAHALFPGARSESLLFLLDSAGIDCSVGSACRAGVTSTSHVVTALGADDDLARGALRFSLGRTTTTADVDAALAALPEALARSRAANAAYT